MEKIVKVEISLKSVLLVLATLLGLLIAWQLQGIIVGLLIAYILMSGLAPIVDYLHDSLKFNKLAAIILTYFLALFFIVLLGFIIIPPLINQFADLFTHLPFFLSNTVKTLGLTGTEKEASDYAQNLINFTTGKIDNFSGQVIQVTVGVFSGIFAFFTVALLTFFLLLEREKIKENIFILFPKIPKQRTTRLAHLIEKKLGAWVIGQLILGLIIGIFTWIGLFVLGIPYALPLAVIAGILELVPIIGPIISSIPAIIVALVQSPILGLGVGAYFLIIQQVENSILVPKVMEKAVGLSPIIVILVLLIGGSLMGIVGALLAVPVAAVAKVIFDDYRENGLLDAK